MPTKEVDINGRKVNLLKGPLTEKEDFDTLFQKTNSCQAGVGVDLDSGNVKLYFGQRAGIGYGALRTDEFYAAVKAEGGNLGAFRQAELSRVATASNIDTIRLPGGGGVFG